MSERRGGRHPLPAGSEVRLGKEIERRRNLSRKTQSDNGAYGSGSDADNCSDRESEYSPGDDHSTGGESAYLPDGLSDSEFESTPDVREPCYRALGSVITTRSRGQLVKSSIAFDSESEYSPEVHNLCDQASLIVTAEPFRRQPVESSGSNREPTKGRSEPYRIKLPLYSPFLPPIDRTLRGQDFFEDLRAKRIIPGYDETRFLCWCKVAKSNGSQEDPWAIQTSHGVPSRQFPQFPLKKSSIPRQSEDVDPIPENSCAAGQQTAEFSTKTRHFGVDLPEYSPFLPIIDRSSQGQAFYEDLRKKQIIAGYDEQRFSCWRHAAKADRGCVRLSILHLGSRSVRGVRTRTPFTIQHWYTHAQVCEFLKDPWARIPGATAGDSRKYPRFPLIKPALPVAGGETRVSSSSADCGQVSTNEVSRASLWVPPVDGTFRGLEFYQDLAAKKIIAGFDEERFSCWCHVAYNAKGKSSAQKAHKWWTHAKTCQFLLDPWAEYSQDGVAMRRFPQFPLEKPKTSGQGENTVATSEGVPLEEQVAARSSGDGRLARVFGTPSPDYSPFLPSPDRTLSQQAFYEDLLSKKIIADYDATHYKCWCRMGDSAWPYTHSRSRKRKGSMATSKGGGKGVRLFPQYPLHKPDHPTEGFRKPARQPDPISITSASLGKSTHKTVTIV
ncbi:hypothetical protein NliqN6_2291 [Naganishia liquefaciens]|uniref:Uncharacterized protein n=1 Tax=Naganishia liquefaciens TaxID=104408 RepID=A0A8H3TRY1_9TREE|nr:hypothetical protein NliqN6_2291 [Naganishia liquefaciens]